MAMARTLVGNEVPLSPSTQNSGPALAILLFLKPRSFRPRFRCAKARIDLLTDGFSII